MKLTAVLLSFTLLLTPAVPAGAAESDAPKRAYAGPGVTSLKLPAQRRTVSDELQMQPEEMLSDLRDARLCLGQIKQQAVNLFLESTRVVVHAQDPPLEMSPTKITADMLDESKEYIPPRKAWLVLFVNTMEPIIQLLVDDIHDVDTNGRKVPPPFREKIDPLWKTWQEDVLAINQALDQIQSMIGPDAGTNLPLARAALLIYNKADELDRTRYSAVQILREEFLKPGESAGSP